MDGDIAQPFLDERRVHNRDLVIAVHVGEISSDGAGGVDPCLMAQNVCCIRNGNIFVSVDVTEQALDLDKGHAVFFGIRFRGSAFEAVYNELFVIGITVDVLIDIVRERVISDRGNGRGDSDFLERSAVDERTFSDRRNGIGDDDALDSFGALKTMTDTEILADGYDRFTVDLARDLKGIRQIVGDVVVLIDLNTLIPVADREQGISLFDRIVAWRIHIVAGFHFIVVGAVIDHRIGVAAACTVILVAVSPPALQTDHLRHLYDCRGRSPAVASSRNDHTDGVAIVVIVFSVCDELRDRVDLVIGRHGWRDALIEILAHHVLGVLFGIINGVDMIQLGLSTRGYGDIAAVV